MRVRVSSKQKEIVSTQGKNMDLKEETEQMAGMANDMVRGRRE